MNDTICTSILGAPPLVVIVSVFLVGVIVGLIAARRA